MLSMCCGSIDMFSFYVLRLIEGAPLIKADYNIDIPALQ